MLFFIWSVFEINVLNFMNAYAHLKGMERFDIDFGLYAEYCQ